MVLKPDQKLSVDEMRAFVEKEVAPYKRLKGGVEFVNSIQKSQSGKILRRLIKAQELEKHVRK